MAQMVPPIPHETTLDVRRVVGMVKRLTPNKPGTAQPSAAGTEHSRFYCLKSFQINVINYKTKIFQSFLMPNALAAILKI